MGEITALMIVGLLALLSGAVIHSVLLMLVGVIVMGATAYWILS